MRALSANLFAALSIALVAACGSTPPPTNAASGEVPASAPTEIKLERFGMRPGAPYAKAVRLGDTIYLSGQLGLDTETRKLVEGGVAAETTRALENIGGVLKEMGSSVQDVAKCTVYLADIADFAAMNEAYSHFFGENRPARSALGGIDLVMQARVEIECIARGHGGGVH
jgi:2-iminobutanoate/2-iminopropanoate deaminase